MKKPSTRLTALVLSLALLLTSCGGGASATTMRLRKTEGTVGVSDSEGKDLALKDNLGLYSGYQVGTQAESYAWIDLDNVKLTKMDANSAITIAKEGKKLEINVESGSLFFNVTEPLEEDETMDIRTSSMLVGIRGTCGWVTQNTAALLEGTVEVAAREQTVTVTAGEMAVLTAEGALEVRPLAATSVPAFVREEVAEDEGLAADIQDTTGMDLTVDPMGVYADILDRYRISGKIFLKTVLDFQNDGNPEFLLIHESLAAEGQYMIEIYANGPNGPGPIGQHLFDSSWSRIVLLESDGQLLLGDISIFDDIYDSFWIDYYRVIDEDGSSDWVEELLYHGLDGDRTLIMGDGLDGYYQSALGEGEIIDAILQNYTEVKVLTFSQDGQEMMFVDV